MVGSPLIRIRRRLSASDGCIDAAQFACAKSRPVRKLHSQALERAVCSEMDFSGRTPVRNFNPYADRFEPWNL